MYLFATIYIVFRTGYVFIFWDVSMSTLKQLKYFGSTIQENGSFDLEIEKKNGSETRRVISKLNLVSWNTNILHSMKLLIYKKRKDKR
jgi:hypothetical protein